MDTNSIKKTMRLFICILAVIGAVFYGYAVPALGKAIAGAYPEFANCYYPWLIVISLTALPCYVVLIELWKLSKKVANNQVFEKETVKIFNKISFMSAIDILFFLIMNLAFMLVDMNHPSILIGSFVITIIGAGFSFCAKVAGEYVEKAALLQEETELTI